MNILLTGGSGFVGKALTQHFKQLGHSVHGLSRRTTTPPYWAPEKGLIDLGNYHFDVVIHLAGENIANGRWSDERKDKILTSRVEGTACVAEFFAKDENRPQLLICSSAVGIYGDHGADELTESSSHGDDFLAQVCKQWEAALQPVIHAGVRVVNMRLGMVLGANGGALAKMLLPFKLGLGGVIGSGQQFISWITVTDLVRAVEHIISQPELSGPINFSSPHPVSNREFTKILGQQLQRPTLVPLPAFAAKLALGEMADALLLSSIRVLPARLQQSGFQFSQPTLESALKSALK